jgi:hypothetical protein
MNLFQGRELEDVIYSFVNAQRLYQGYVKCANAQVESVTQHLSLKSLLDLATEKCKKNFQKSFSKRIGGRK